LQETRRTKPSGVFFDFFRHKTALNASYTSGQVIHIFCQIPDFAQKKRFNGLKPT